LPDPPADCDIDTDIARWPQPSGEHGHTGPPVPVRRWVSARRPCGRVRPRARQRCGSL